MISRPVLAPLALIAVLGLFGSNAAAESRPAGTSSVEVVITGTIKNFDEVAPLIVEGTFIQLVPLSEDESYSFSTDAQGRFAYASDLPKVAAPAERAFTFVVPAVPPGKYQLAAQRLKAQEGGMGQRPWFGTDPKRVIVFEVPAKAKDPLEIRAGRLVVWTH